MRVVVVGSGGREHAHAHLLGRTADVVVSPGRATIPGSVSAKPEDLDADLFVIGPEVALVDGLADRLRAQGKRVFGPGADGARLEGSKAYMKAIAETAGVPTARYGSFTDAEAAIGFMRTLPPPYVVKTDYLAAGKGVLVTESLDEAIDDVRSKVEHGAVVVEEGMTGPELSLLAICDGQRAVNLPAAQDHKRVGDGDTGPNTGGMGAWMPPGWFDTEVDAMDRIVRPTLRALGDEGIDYRGVLYAGLMITADGPKLVEFNVRFGDPEAQALLPCVTSDFADLLLLAAEGRMVDTGVSTEAPATTICLCAEGYPGSYRTGDVIDGIADAEALDGVLVFHAGTDLDADGRVVTAGGRVLNVTAVGPDSTRRAYEAASRITFEGMFYRTDIGGGVR